MQVHHIFGLRKQLLVTRNFLEFVKLLQNELYFPLKSSSKNKILSPLEHILEIYLHGERTFRSHLNQEKGRRF